MAKLHGWAGSSELDCPPIPSVTESCLLAHILFWTYAATHIFTTGVISWGYECAKPRWPGIYTDVSKYGDWIRSNMKSNDQNQPVAIG